MVDQVPTQNPRAGFRLVTPLRVRYAECDMQGIVFNAHYLAYADVAVTEYFRAITNAGAGEMNTKFLEMFGGDNWVRHADVDFRASATADDMIDVAARITRFGRTSYRLLCHIIRGDELLTVIQISYVWFDPKTQSVEPVAQSFIDAVTEFEPIAPERG